MPSYTLDSWAVLHLLQDGDNAAAVEVALDDAWMSWINAGEVWYIVSRRRGAREADAIIGDLRRVLGNRLVVPDEGLVLAAAAVKSRWQMAYADAFAVATATSTATTLLTGDPELLVAGRAWDAHDLRP